MVEQRAARRFDHADALACHLAAHHQFVAKNVRVEQQFLDRLGGMQQFNHPRPVIGQGEVNRLAFAQRRKLAPLFLGQWRGNEIAVVDARQRPHSIPASLRPQRVDERELHVAPRLDLLAQHLGIAPVIQMIEQDLSLVVFGPQTAVIQIQRPVGAHQAEVVGADGGEIAEIARVQGISLLDQFNDVAAPLDHQLQICQQIIALLQGQRLVDPTGHIAATMHPLAGGYPDDLLTVFAQPYPLTGDVGKIGHHPADVAAGDLGIELEQEIRRSQMEEMHRVRLQGLAVVHQPTNFLGGRGDLVRPHQLIHCFGRRQVMADRANPAQPLHHHGQFPVRPALDEFLETAKLDDVQPRLADVMIPIRQQRNLAMPFDPAQRVNGNPTQIFRLGSRFQGAHDGMPLSNRLRIRLARQVSNWNCWLFFCCKISIIKIQLVINSILSHVLNLYFADTLSMLIQQVP